MYVALIKDLMSAIGEEERDSTMNFQITRRQFLQYCTASAAALGLSQVDLLKLEKALATPNTSCTQPSPSVIWLTAQACSGCPVSLLNRVGMLNGKYYDADFLNFVYGSSLPTPSTTTDIHRDPANFYGIDDTVNNPDTQYNINPLYVVNDAADLVVGDAMRALIPGLTRSLLWADDMSGAFPGSLLEAYAGAFPAGYITLDWNTTLMAAAGDIAVSHLRKIRNGGGLLGKFLLVVDGSIPAGNKLPESQSKNYCWVFDNDIGGGQRAVRESDPQANGFTGLSIDFGKPVAVNDALQWLAGAPGCLGIIAQGTCSSYGGIPAGAGNKTGATSLSNYLASKGISTPIVNVPGCPPHPDWTVYVVAYILINSTLGSLALPTLDSLGRPLAVYTGSTGQEGITICYDCSNQPTMGTPQAAQELGEAGCLGGLGCKGPYTVADCPIRQKNTMDDGTRVNWCVGAQGPGAPSGYVADGIGEALHPCQGCVMPSFPDWAELALSEGEKTSKKIKGFYNA